MNQVELKEMIKAQTLALPKSHNSARNKLTRCKLCFAYLLLLLNIYVKRQLNQVETEGRDRCRNIVLSLNRSEKQMQKA